jgi:cell volume regulation protein A
LSANPVQPLFQSVVSATSTLELTIVGQTGLILIVGLVSARLAKRLGIPMLIPLLLTGLAIGPVGLGFFHPESSGFSFSNLAFFVVPLFLFGQGLSTDLRELREVAKPVASLATVGVVLTALGTMVLAHFILTLPWIMAALLGTVVSATDPTVVFPLLEGGKLRKRIALIAKAESALNDPTSVVMFTVVLDIIQGASQPTALSVFAEFAKLFFGGTAVGAVCGLYAVALLDKLNFREQLNYTTLIVFIITFTVAEYFGTSGITASLVAGIVVGNELKTSRFDTSERDRMYAFWDNVSFLTQVVIFLLLGLYVTRGMFGWPEVLYSALLTELLIVVVRPVAVAASTAFEKMGVREKAFVSWVGARGAVPAALASTVVGYGIASPYLAPFANTIFSTTFFVVVTTVLVVSFLTKPVVRVLGVEEQDLFEEYRVAKARLMAVTNAIGRLKEEGTRGVLPDKSYQRLESELLERAKKYDSMLRKIESAATPAIKQVQALRERRHVVLVQLETLRDLRRRGELSEPAYAEASAGLLRELEEAERALEKAWSTS